MPDAPPVTTALLIRADLLTENAWVAELFPGFELARVDVGEATLRVRYGGDGPPLLLLHGHPQTHLMWHAVAPGLAERFTVVAPDLRGYGESSKPASAPDHEPFSKRAMARDQVELMRRLGFERFLVCGHDRGARCAYRLALDHPERVERLAVLDIIPTGEAFRRADARFGLAYWHWFFLAQPDGLPERMIAADPDAFYFRQRYQARELFAPEALEDYLRCVRRPETIHAMCEDYRAGATYDFELDEADRAASKRIACPVLVLWGGRGKLPELYDDVLEIWRSWADDVRGRAIDCGHFLAEEAPDETLAELLGFFGPH
jgi:haloacetate dehalogenase